MADRTTGTAAQRRQLTGSLMAYGASFTELGRRFAVALGVHSTDAFALLEIAAADEGGTPLSPALLSKRIPLSSGAMTALLNRLERAGYVHRSREAEDRRVVTLRASAEAKRLADEFFAPVNARQDAELEGYPPELLRKFEELLGALRASIDEELAQPD
ncbi:MarR family winged helix-turn-helix transcriptional regulator [Nocardia cyriacigeorgica]|jgi:MarR family transcriptional regulator, organic hydroperoxide resistance regulator|uniref:MarR family winged helix-turn-helix transcriptional regulator n=1 Tax=Nocardia cyriacigeorgica TaxID=135487 RepID=UPI000CE9D056|nr:MarR family transcriptional regulator [Nocardia cyriacigeorgica]AVH21746.1 MarR family transcriptional regulator [Nocardia cyriacigeorgica]MBF6321234.1 MarR family transcriptional regulator [Nocardia cyriacigeorgica]MBF6495071.1 MarR family transcriptional regulator [Nocardia cyriacigeorgica]PPJ12798.1 MarR family transcriptional regulator [Nocardia cyriacigeorgica]